MASLKLSKLSDRTPVRITINLTPDLKRALEEYAVLYAASYGQEASPGELIPAMIEAFLASDRGFAKARKSISEQ